MSFYDDEDGFIGQEPQVFTGNRAEAESFATQWYIYTATNELANVMTPHKIALLFLTYIKGLLVNTWVQQQVRWLHEELERGISAHNLALAREVARHSTPTLWTAYAKNEHEQHCAQEYLWKDMRWTSTLPPSSN